VSTDKCMIAVIIFTDIESSRTKQFSLHGGIVVTTFPVTYNIVIVYKFCLII